MGLTIKNVEVRSAKTFLGKTEDVIGKKVAGVWRRAKMLGIETLDFPRKGNNIAQIQEYQLKLIHQICSLIVKAFPETSIGELM